MVKKDKVARLICSAAGITRKKPRAADLSKWEMLKLHTWMVETKRSFDECHLRLLAAGLADDS